MPACAGMTAALLAACGGSDPFPGSDARVCRDANPLRNPYFGDLHIHTKYSLDASTQGTAVSPHDAYRFALGERIPVQPYFDGIPQRSTQIARPLDFAAVTDHSEFFGETEICTHEEYDGYDSPECRFYRDDPSNAFLAFNAQLANEGQPNAATGRQSVPRFAYCGPNGANCLQAARTPWGDIQRAAEAFYDRSEDCSFTTFVGYEWTGSPQSNNWHRNVIFETDTVPALPISYMDEAAPEYLWRGLAEACRPEDGCRVLTIPHNSNLSAGIMFSTMQDNGLPFDAAFAQEKQDNEPLAEIMQHKGQSECDRRTASAADELCGYELLYYDNLAGDRLGETNPPDANNFLRYALLEGLVQQGNLGVNPFKYGLIGSTDSHIGAAGGVAEEAAFPGHGGAGQPNRDAVPQGLTDLVEYNPGGLAVVWSEQNTRESLYAALRRRETYGTSGPRIVMRFFGGWNFPSDLCAGENLVPLGYSHGVPMGGDLPAGPAGGKPRFAVAALRDPGGNGELAQPLQRLQIVKGWVEGSTHHEEVFDVAGDPDNGASVNPATCETAGEGFASLCTVWEDPTFDPARPAFYYARVVQNPSCRWSAHQCNAGGITAASCPLPNDHPFAGCCDARYPKTVQERAWTSPIWYRPS